MKNVITVWIISIYQANETSMHLSHPKYVLYQSKDSSQYPKYIFAHKSDYVSYKLDITVKHDKKSTKWGPTKRDTLFVNLKKKKKLQIFTQLVYRVSKLEAFLQNEHIQN